MERTSKVARQGVPVILRLKARRGCPLLIAMAFAAYFPALGQQGKEKADFLIAERPEQFLIYNKYQQNITAQERAALVPYVPMRVIKANDILGDGFTACTQVEVNGNSFYLLKDNAGDLIGSERVGYHHIFSGVTTLYDTVQVLANRPLYLSLPSGPDKIPIHRGEKILRVFRSGDLTYAGRPAPQVLYGWFSPGGGDVGALRQTDAKVTAIPDRVLKQVEAEVEDANRVLAGLFSYFNQQTRQRQQTPQWTIEASEQSVVVTLQNYPSGHDFSRSARYLAKDFENFLLGTDFRVLDAPGRIEISRAVK